MPYKGVSAFSSSLLYSMRGRVKDLTMAEGARLGWVEDGPPLEQAVSASTCEATEGEGDSSMSSKSTIFIFSSFQEELPESLPAKVKLGRLRLVSALAERNLQRKPQRFILQGLEDLKFSLEFSKF